MHQSISAVTPAFVLFFLLLFFVFGFVFFLFVVVICLFVSFVCLFVVVVRLLFFFLAWPLAGKGKELMRESMFACKEHKTTHH